MKFSCKKIRSLAARVAGLALGNRLDTLALFNLALDFMIGEFNDNWFVSFSF